MQHVFDIVGSDCAPLHRSDKHLNDKGEFDVTPLKGMVKKASHRSGLDPERLPE